MTEQFYVVIELARVGRISVMIEDFYVATKLATTESSAAHDKAGCEKAGAHDSVAPCCVATEEAMCARQTRLSVRNRPGQAYTIGNGHCASGKLVTVRHNT